MYLVAVRSTWSMYALNRPGEFITPQQQFFFKYIYQPYCNATNDPFYYYFQQYTTHARNRVIETVRLVVFFSQIKKKH